jgi:hypothetical protein
MQRLTSKSRAGLRKNLKDHFNLEELNLICFDLGIERDDIAGGTRGTVAANLISYCERLDITSELIGVCEIARPQANWRELIELDQDVQETSRDVPELRHRRDLRTLRKVFNQIHTHALDEFFRTARMKWYDDTTFSFCESFSALVEASDFHIYDTALAKRIEDFYVAWNHSLNFTEFLVPYHNRAGYRFMETCEGYDEQHAAVLETALSDFRSAIDAMEQAYKDFISYVRENYVELDIDETNRVAWESNRKHQAEIEALFKDSELERGD